MCASTAEVQPCGHATNLIRHKILYLEGGAVRLKRLMTYALSASRMAVLRTKAAMKSFPGLPKRSSSKEVAPHDARCSSAFGPDRRSPLVGFAAGGSSIEPTLLLS